MAKAAERAVSDDDAIPPAAAPATSSPTAGDMRDMCAEVAERLAAAARAETRADPLECTARGPLAELAAAFGLDRVDAGIVAVAAAAELDARFGRLFADLDAGRARPRPRADVALAVAGGSPFAPGDRARIGERSTLRRAALVELHDADLPFPDQTIGVPERVVAHLLGSTDVDPALSRLLVPAVEIDAPAVLEVVHALAAGLWIVWIRDSTGAGRSVAATALQALAAPPVVVDLARLGGGGLADVLPIAVREAGLCGGGVVVGPVDPRRDLTALRDLSGTPLRPIVLVSPSSWDPAASNAVPVLVDQPVVDAAARLPHWQGVTESLGIDDPAGAAAELSLLRLPPESVHTVGAAATALAVAAGEQPALGHLRAAALAQGAGRLDTLAQRVVPQAGFDDLVLPAALIEELQMLPGRYRTRDIVLDQWGLDRRAGRGRGITCLFAGSSGTGKTLAAEVVAKALGVDMFVIDLSQVVDKYIGETEKNLERVFTDAEGVNGVLLFDEADALFGKRSDVRGAHDRHANVEVAYLLQRMERYEGIAVLTTNLRANIDEAFSRRIDVMCIFPEPGPAERLALWRLHLPHTVPQAGDVDLAMLADQLPVSGGTIRNITLTAAHTAAITGRPVDQRMLVAAARREYAKLGRIFTSERLGAAGDEG